MKKTAKQMFEELGWHIDRIEYNSTTNTKTMVSGHEIKNFIKYRHNNYICRAIYFDLNEKCIYLCLYDEETELDLELLQAINKQVEELGWGKEGENETLPTGLVPNTIQTSTRGYNSPVAPDNI